VLDKIIVVTDTESYKSVSLIVFPLSHARTFAQQPQNDLDFTD